MMDISTLYADFHVPIAEFDCGEKCSPYNEYGVPFCCDTRHSVPTAYDWEWSYLRSHTDLWHRWEGETDQDTRALQEETPDGQVLIECLGHTRCQREFRSFTCRAFPFFPYLNEAGEFLGLSPYPEYRDRCWLISNLKVVNDEYRQAFIETYQNIFQQLPEERENFAHHSREVRRLSARRGDPVLLLHRDGRAYQVDPKTEVMVEKPLDEFPAFGVYKIAAEMPFPDEITGKDPS